MPYLGKPLHGSPASLSFCNAEISFFPPNTFSSMRQFELRLASLLLCCWKSGRRTIGKAAGELRLLLLMLITIVSFLAPCFPICPSPPAAFSYLFALLPQFTTLPVAIIETPGLDSPPGGQGKALPLCALRQQINRVVPFVRGGVSSVHA